jgi:hypothetical protein
MLATLLQSLLDLRRTDTVTVGGLTYSTEEDGGLTLVPPPVASVITLESLSGFVEAVKAGIDDFEQAKVAVLVDDYKAVKLVSLHANEYGQRKTFVSAQYKEFGGFRFGQYTDPESFIIAAQGGFVQTENLDRLVALISALSVQNSVQTADDGISQTVTVKKGAVMRGTAQASPRWPLQARRTFTETEQPMTEFLLRMKGEDGQLPNVALHEVDGGAWKHDAMVNVSKYLRAALPDFTHLA